METYFKNKNFQAKKQAEQAMSDMDDFIDPNNPRNIPPRLDNKLNKIWNNGRRLTWEWSEDSEQQINSEDMEDQDKANQAERYRNDIELWKNEIIRPIRNYLMVEWFDSLRSKPELWDEQNEEVKTEARELRQILKDWPAIFTEYVTDQEIEDLKPSIPSYIIQ